MVQILITELFEPQTFLNQAAKDEDEKQMLFALNYP